MGMTDIGETIAILKAYTDCNENRHKKCDQKCLLYGHGDCSVYANEYIRHALELLKEQEKEIKALHLLVEWAEECDFGFDQFRNEYERYKDEIKDMKYIDGMIHIAKRTLEDQGAFAEGR